MSILFKTLYTIVWPFFNLFYPTFCIGRENLPREGGLICANHSDMADPLMMLYACKGRVQPRFMAKAELLRVPVLGPVLKKVGVFGVERGKGDMGALDTAVSELRQGHIVLMYPEGTRVRRGRKVRVKSGAMRIAVKSGCEVVPMFVPQRKRLFRRNTVVIGPAYKPEISEQPEIGEYAKLSQQLLERIYSLALTNEKTKAGLWDADKTDKTGAE